MAPASWVGSDLCVKDVWVSGCALAVSGGVYGEIQALLRLSVSWQSTGWLCPLPSACCNSSPAREGGWGRGEQSSKHPQGWVHLFCPCSPGLLLERSFLIQKATGKRWRCDVWASCILLPRSRGLWGPSPANPEDPQVEGGGLPCPDFRLLGLQPAWMPGLGWSLPGETHGDIVAPLSRR